MITNIFFLFSAFFSKTVGFGSVFRAEMNSACKNPNKSIFIGFTENSLFSENFRTGYSMAIFMLTAKKLIYTNLAIFGFFLSNKHDSFGFRKFCLKLIRENHKKQKIMITNIFFLFSAYFSKTVGFGSVFRAEMNSACKNTLNKGIFIGFTENSLFSENFRTGYSMAIFMPTAKKLIYTNLAIFGFFLSNKQDSFGFRKFCLKVKEKITKNRK